MKVFKNGCDLNYFERVLHTDDCGLVVCPECGDMLGFDRSDVKSDIDKCYIVCPCCGSRVRVSSKFSDSGVRELNSKNLQQMMGEALAFGKFIASKGENKTLVINGVDYKLTYEAVKRLGGYEDALMKGYDEAHAFLIAFYTKEYEG